MEYISEIIPLTFNKPEYFWVLTGLIPLILFLFAYTQYSSQKVLMQPWFKLHMPGSHIPTIKHSLRACLLTISAAALLVGAWAEPERIIFDKEPIYGRVRITFLLDTSLSMKYGHDLKPDRLTKAKQVITESTNQLWYDPELSGKYSLSLIPFAGAGIPLYTSFTTSKDGFTSLMQHVDEKTITTAGTNLYAALRAYKSLLDSYPVKDDKTINIAILISDGGKDEARAQEPSRIIKIIKALPPRTVINTVGIGSKKFDTRCLRRKKEKQKEPLSARQRDSCSSVVPVSLIVEDKDGNVIDFLRKNPNDDESPILRSELDEQILKDIVNVYGGGGVYAFFENRESFDAILKETILTHRILAGYSEEVRYEPAAIWFLIPALLIIAWYSGNIGWCTRLFRGIRIFR